MWYRTGTITVTANSATVTGSGTAWVENARVGDGLQGPDGRLYEITNIASNTALSITPAYQGSTASGQAYWIIPVQGYVKKSADRLAAITDELADIPGRVTQNEGDIVSVEQGLSTLELAALLKSGNLSGLADLKQSQLNLGVIQSLTGEVLNTDNCTVITNANGTAWRFPNGLQICSICKAFPRSSDSTTYYFFAEWTFPAPFTSGGNTVHIASVDNVFGSGWGEWHGPYCRDVANTWAKAQFWANSGKAFPNSQEFILRWMAVGTWR